ncbi:MAG: hypothetical protein JSR58_07920 [Verrucomicrobia bacterium]|nr:hypothetical protein [Verrucomicrobiota bacterium]
MAKRRKKKISMLEAVDRLSNLAELDAQKPREIRWIDPSNREETREKIQETFHVVSDYLHHLYQKERTEMADPLAQRGVRAVMELAKEAALKVGKYTDLFKEVVEIPAYDELRKFYSGKVQSKIKKGPEKEQWEYQIREGALEAEMRALRDLEMVRKDHDYELFYITKQDGTPFWSPQLIKHIRWVGNFDEALLSEEVENPLNQIDVVLDRDFHLSAKQIEEESSDLLDQFYKEAMQHKANPFVSSLLKVAMALFLAENPKNLQHNSTDKHSLDYFIDFTRYLREALLSEDYLKNLGFPEEDLSPFDRTCQQLAHTFCGLLYLRGAAHDDILKLIGQFALHRSEGASLLLPSLESYDKALREKMATFPSGPVLKVLKAFRTGEEHAGFDPHLLNNLPHKLFGISSEDLNVSFLHLPSPTRQMVIDQAYIYPEFAGYLRYLSPQKHLLVNLQDRTSWKEHARSSALEKFPLVLTLPKDTDFYHQIHDYADLDDAKALCSQLSEQVASGESCGFHFPGKISTNEINSIIRFIHKEVYQSKRTLTHAERCDFIELFYQFLILYVMSVEKPASVSFTCKDGIDAGAAFSASLYGLLRLLSSKEAWTDNDRDFFLFSLYGPALLLRHRIIDQSRLARAFSALGRFEEAIKTSRASILKACSDLLPELPLQKLKLSEAA